jgi:hypothetical protein
MTDPVLSFEERGEEESGCGEENEEDEDLMSERLVDLGNSTVSIILFHPSPSKIRKLRALFVLS